MQITKTGRTARNSESGSITDILVSCFLLSSKAESFLKAKHIELAELWHWQLHPSFFCRVPFACCEPSARKAPHSVANFSSCNPCLYIFCLPTIHYWKQNLCWAHLREAYNDEDGRTKWARQQFPTRFCLRRSWALQKPFQMISDIKHLLTHFLTICISPLEKCLLKAFPLFF